MAEGRLKGRCALVSGAGGPMGHAVATRFAREGASLLLTDISARRLEATLADVRAACPGIAAIAFRADITAPAEVDAMLAQASADLPPFDVLVNVVGGMRGALFEPLLSMPAERWDQTMALNLRGTVLLTQRLAPGMRERGYGRIVNFSSINYAGEEGQADYAAAKAAVAALTRSLAMELAPQVNVNCVAPGLIRTSVVERMDAQTVARYRDACALKRLGDPDEIASAVLFLASEEASYVTGEILRVSGGRWPIL